MKNFVPHKTRLWVYLCSMDDIKTWIDSEPRDYAVGVRLLEQHGASASLVRVFANRSPRFAMRDLVAELRHLAATARPAKAPKPQNEAVPPLVQEAKQRVHEVWVKLSRIHRALYDIGTANTSEAVAERLRLMQEREPLIERYNSIYEAKEGYFGGSVKLEQLQEVMDGKPLPDVLHPKTKPTPHAAMSDLDLIKRIKATKAAINRCQNQLLYQKDTSQKQPDPMPDCPRRDSIASRLDGKKKELAALLSEKERRGL